MTIYEISEQLNAFVESVELGDIPEEAIANTLEALHLEFESQAEELACTYKNVEAEIKAMEIEKNHSKSESPEKRK